jgi:hypothetical protein
MLEQNASPMTRTALLPGVLLAVALATAPAAAQTDCAAEAAKLRKAESELPRLEVAPPADRQIVCITLETNMLFARRLALHLQQCPRSPYAKSAGVWNRTGADFAAQFSDRGCKPTIRGYRG